jgi:hypothetical protein
VCYLCSTAGTKDANNQLVGATYAELYALDGKRNHTMIADTLLEFDDEIKVPAAHIACTLPITLCRAQNTHVRTYRVTCMIVLTLRVRLHSSFAYCSRCAWSFATTTTTHGHGHGHHHTRTTLRHAIYV